MIEIFSQWKWLNKNEDSFWCDGNTFVVVDWSTDKSGRLYNSFTWWELVSKLVSNTILSTDLNGYELVSFLNTKVRDLYISLDILDDTYDPKYRFTCLFCVVRIVKNILYITQVGDVWIRINGTEVYQQIKQVDINNAQERSDYIIKTWDIAWSRDHIMPLLVKQFDYQNNINSVLWYGAIDWFITPEKFVHILEYDLNLVRTIELFSDGYCLIPSEISIWSRESAFEKVEKEDPYKYLHYKSTKTADDRTIMIIKL